MAWALQFDGVNDYLNFSTNISFGPTIPFTFRCVCTVPPHDNGEYYIIAKGNGSSRDAIYIKNGRVVVKPGTTRIYRINDIPILEGETIDIEYIYDGVGSYTANVNGEIKTDNITYVGDSLRQIGRKGSGSSYYVGLLSYIYILTDTQEVHWEATASDHSASTDQPTLIDTIGSNDALGFNFSSFDPSVWVNLASGAFIDTPSNSNSISNSDIVLLSGVFNISDTTNNTLNLSGSDLIKLAGSVSIVDFVNNSSSLSKADNVKLIGALDVIESRNNSLSLSYSDSVLFTSSITINDSVNNSQSMSHADFILLIGAFNIDDNVKNTHSLSNQDSILFLSETIINDSLNNSQSLSLLDSIQIGKLSFNVKNKTNINSRYFSTNISDEYLSTNINNIYYSTNING